MTDKDLAELVQQRLDCMAVAKQMETDAAKLQEQVREELRAREVTGFDDGRVRVTVSTVTRETLKPEKLVELGVAVATIRAATVASSYEQMRFSVVKAKEPA